MKKQIFLSYAREDRILVEDLYDRLKTSGYEPWMDTKNVKGGELWDRRISLALKNSDFILVCLSKFAVNKRGYLQKEIKEALNIWKEKLADDIYLIPIRLDNCDVPDLLRDFQWINYFEESGWEILTNSLDEGVIRYIKTIKEMPTSNELENSEKLKSKHEVIILLVEDYLHSRIIVTRLLKQHGYNTIDIAENGLEAIELTSKKQYDLILMDMQMPVMNGFEAIKLIRKLPNFSRIPIIGLTAFAMRGDREKVLLAGGTDYLPKPIDSAEFINKINYYSKNLITYNWPSSLILMAHHDNLLLKELTDFLFKNNFKNILVANNGIEVLQLLNKNIFDLIFLGNNMGELNLNMLLPIIRIFNEYQKTPIFYLTDDGQKYDKLGETRKYFSDYINTFLPEKIIQKIDSTLRRNSLNPL